MKKSKSKLALFLELARPNEQGVSRWVRTQEFTGRYKRLALGNGGDFCRAGSSLEKQYVVEKDRSITAGNRIDAIRLNGYQEEDAFNQAIRKDICEAIRQRRCVMLGVNGNSVNTRIEVDHKEGRKSNLRLNDLAAQREDDFQPLCKAANDIKRQICKACKQTGKRWDAKYLEGNPYSFYAGNEVYSAELGCVGCYQYDPVAYRRVCARRVCEEAVKAALAKIYPEQNLEETINEEQK